MIFAEVKHDCPLEQKVYANYLAAASKQFADHQAENAGWFLVRVPVKREQFMFERMERAGLDVWLPHTTETRIKAERKGGHRKKITEEKQVLIFDGHVLARFCPSGGAWHGIMNILGVQAIYARPESFEANRPDKRLESALSSRVVERLRQLETETHGEKIKPKFKPGDSVNVIEGPFMGHTATVSHKKATWGLVNVEIALFGGNTPATMDETQLEAV